MIVLAFQAPVAKPKEIVFKAPSASIRPRVKKRFLLLLMLFGILIISMFITQTDTCHYREYAILDDYKNPMLDDWGDKLLDDRGRGIQCGKIYFKL